MKFLEEVHFSENEFGIQVVVKLAQGWEIAAQKFPSERIDEILEPSVAFANQRLKELGEEIRLDTGRYGLHHISLLPERAGLDLFPDQNSYISHNLTRSAQIGSIMPIILDYLKLLEYAEPKS